MKASRVLMVHSSFSLAMLKGKGGTTKVSIRKRQRNLAGEKERPYFLLKDKKEEPEWWLGTLPLGLVYFILKTHNHNALFLNTAHL